LVDLALIERKELTKIIVNEMRYVSTPSLHLWLRLWFLIAEKEQTHKEQPEAEAKKPKETTLPNTNFLALT